MDSSLLLLGINGLKVSSEEALQIRELQPAGFILFSRNIESARQVRELTDELRFFSESDPILAIDQEGGRVTRTAGIAPALPSAAAFSVNPNTEMMARAGDVTAEMLQVLGLNLNFAPVLDIDHFPESQNALRQRCWGRNSQDILDRAGVWNRWSRNRGMASCGKHFPACGRAMIDPHDDLPFSQATQQEMMKDDVIPYTALVSELDSVMLAHVMYPNIDSEFPASLSKRVVTHWLREQLGFEKHLILTDDLDMGAIIKRYGQAEAAKLAIAAGNDLAMICHNTVDVHQAAKAIAELPDDILEAAHKRLRIFRKKLRFPPAFSEQRWQGICARIEEIRALIPEPQALESESVVTRY